MRPPHFEIENCIYFVTSRVRDGRYLLKASVACTLVEKIKQKRNDLGFNIFAYVVMPNHYHFLIQYCDKHSISDIMRHIDGSSARSLNELTGNAGSFWQGGFFDFVVSTEEKLIEKVNYIHHNPVKWGLVREAHDYQFSSARDYIRDYGACYF